MNTTPYSASMFESIKSAIAKNETKSSAFKDMLNCKPGNEYLTRLLPNTESPDKTLLHYYTFSWASFATGKRITVVTPSTWDQRCPIAEERYRVYRSGTEAEKAKIKAIRRTENWLVNLLVIKDPVNPENNLKNKALRFGKQLHKVIQTGIDDTEDLGPRVFDLSPAGCSLLIKVEQQGEYPVYTSSKFRSPKEVEGLPSTEYDRVYKGAIDLDSLIIVKTYSELAAILDEHYHCKGAPATATAIGTSPVASNASAVPTPPTSTTTAPGSPAPTDDMKLSALLKSLDE